MLEIPEYDPTKPWTLNVLTEDDVAPPSEVKWFRAQLGNIAGKNRFGGYNLEMVWGPTYCDTMNADPGTIKYLDFIHGGFHFPSPKLSNLI